MTLIKVKGHQQKYKCVELYGGYNHTKFDYARYHSLRDKSNVKFFDTAGRTAGRPDGRTDEHCSLHRLTFFQCESKMCFALNSYHVLFGFVNVQNVVDFFFGGGGILGCQ